MTTIDFIKQSIKKGSQNPSLFIRYPINVIRYKGQQFIEVLGDIFRYIKWNNGGNKEFVSLNKFRNIHKGERCYVICTGPSLTKEDVKKLKGKHTFSMNSFLFNDWIEWNPEYYCVIDDGAFQKLKDAIEKYECKEIFVSNYIKRKFKLEDRFLSIPWCDIYLSRLFGGGIRYRFSNDITKTVFEGYTVTYAILQIAAFMGFSEIVLLGCDCGNSKMAIHSIEFPGSKRKVSDSFWDGAYRRMRDAYACAERYSRQYGFRIYNATRGGYLEEFERKDLDELLMDGR